MAVAVRRGSHTQKVPQVGRPQIAPVTRVRPVNTRASSPQAAAVTSHQADRFHRYITLATVTAVAGDVGHGHHRHVEVEEADGVAHVLVGRAATSGAR